MSSTVRTEPTPAHFTPIQTGESTGVDSSLSASEACGTVLENILIRRWMIDTTSGGDSVITCHWEEAILTE